MSRSKWFSQPERHQTPTRLAELKTTMIRGVGLVAVLAGVLLLGSVSANDVPLVELEVASDEVFARDMVAAVSDTPPDVNCKVSDWKADCDCDPKTLTQIFKRTVRMEQKGNGKPCPSLTEVRPCFPVHCQMTPWTDWDDCNDDLFKIRTRDVQTKPKYGGRECPDNVDKVKCCEDDCIPGPWGKWTCDDSTGKKTRTRPRKKEATSTGVDCKKLKEIRDCDPEDCELFTEEDDPGQYGECFEDKPKRKWYQSKKLQVKKKAKYGGKKCQEKVVYKECEPVDCKLYDANDDPGAYGLCDVGPWDKKCKTKTLGIKIKPAYGGKPCLNRPVLEKKCTIREYLDMFLRECNNNILPGEEKTVDKKSGTKISITWGHTSVASYKQGSKSVQVSLMSYDAAKYPNKLVFQGGSCNNGNNEKTTLTLNLVCGTTLKLYAGTVNGCATTATMEIPVEEVCSPKAP